MRKTVVIRLRAPRSLCCDAPDVHNEGCVILYEDRKVRTRSWEYHCYGCGRSWTESVEARLRHKPKRRQ